MGTVGPKEKPLCKLDSLQKALDQLKPGMVMTKTDDKVRTLRLLILFFNKFQL